MHSVHPIPLTRERSRIQNESPFGVVCGIVSFRLKIVARLPMPCLACAGAVTALACACRSFGTRAVQGGGGGGPVELRWFDGVNILFSLPKSPVSYDRGSLRKKQQQQSAVYPKFKIFLHQPRPTAQPPLLCTSTWLQVVYINVACSCSCHLRWRVQMHCSIAAKSIVGVSLFHTQIVSIRFVCL